MTLLEQITLPDTEVLDQVAGVTGIGWTASILGYLSVIVGYGDEFVTRLVADPELLLYLGIVLFLATAGLDGLTNLLAHREA
jgi:vacuolar-type H+-ATPase subunit I/STV1